MGLLRIPPHLKAGLDPAFLIMKDAKLLIFDLDGTLVDAYPAIISSFNYAMRSLGYPLQNSRVIRKAVGWGDQNLLKPFIKREDLKRAVSVYRRHHQESLLKESRLFPGSRAVLAGLKEKGYKLAVASNRPTRFSWILIRHLGLKKYFDYVLCADKLRRGKPYPEILNRIMQKFSLLPKQTLYIGDMVIDAQAARRAQVRSIIVTTGSSARIEIKKEKPFHMIRRITDLLKLL